VKHDDNFKGYFFRRDPSSTKDQLFRFRPLGPITTPDRIEIWKTFPNFGNRQWWGWPGLVPEWEQGLGD